MPYQEIKELSSSPKSRVVLLEDKHGQYFVRKWNGPVKISTGPFFLFWVDSFDDSWPSYYLEHLCNS